MEILESAMAFAVAMIIFSTVVTGIVELLLRLAGTREKNLKQTVESLFNTIVWPRMKAQLMVPSRESEATARKRLGEEFVQDMIGNPASVASGNETGGRRLSILTRNEGQVDALTTLAFAERLGRTEVGKAIFAAGEAQLDLLVQDFVRTFDRFGRAASEVFRKKAQQTAMVVGIVFALAANVDAGRLFTTFMNNPDVRSSMIEDMQEAAKADKKVTESLAEVSKQIEQGKLEGEQAEAIKAQFEKIEASINALEAKGLPIGYAYYPYCNEGAAGDSACADSTNEGFAILKFLRWALLSILAGILIGLGGPFWFRVFSSLSQIFQVLRSLGVGRKAQQAKPEELAATPSAEESAKPKDVLDAFRVAAQVHAHASVTGDRPPLGADGQPL